MAEDVFLIRLAASGAMVERLRHAQDLLGHAVPRGDVAEVFDRALVALIAELEKRRFGGTKAVEGSVARGRITRGRRNRREATRAATPPDAPADKPATHSRYVSVDVRGVVWVRDGGRCAYVSPDGHRCAATRFIQFHHLRPFEVGGEAAVENIALRCRAHNQYEADVYFAPFRDAMASGAIMSAEDSIRPGAGSVAGGDAPLPR